MRSPSGFFPVLAIFVWALANYELNSELVTSAFIFLQLVGVCTDATLELCYVLMLALPSAILAFGLLVVAFVIGLIPSVRRFVAPHSPARSVLWSGAAFVLGSVGTGLFFYHQSSGRVRPGNIRALPFEEVLHWAATWLPTLLATLVVLLRSRPNRRPELQRQ